MHSLRQSIRRRVQSLPYRNTVEDDMGIQFYIYKYGMILFGPHREYFYSRWISETLVVIGMIVSILNPRSSTQRNHFKQFISYLRCFHPRSFDYLEAYDREMDQQMEIVKRCLFQEKKQKMWNHFVGHCPKEHHEELKKQLSNVPFRKRSDVVPSKPK